AWDRRGAQRPPATRGSLDGSGLVLAWLRRDRGQQDLHFGVSHPRMVAGPAVAVAALFDLLLVIALQPAEPLLALAYLAAALLVRFGLACRRQVDSLTRDVDRQSDDIDRRLRQATLQRQGHRAGSDRS